MICFYVVVLMLGNIEIREMEGELLQPESEVKYFLLLRQAIPNDSSVQIVVHFSPSHMNSCYPGLKCTLKNVYIGRWKCLETQYILGRLT